VRPTKLKEMCYAKDTMIEIELKFEIENTERIIQTLKEGGFVSKRERTYEKTVMYDNPTNLMQVTDGRVRVRQSGDRVEFSYKIPITRSGIKQELEHEVVVSNFSELEKILEKMEFTPTTSYERYRTELEKDGMKATIDDYPFATFLELEGPEDKIKTAAEGLGFDLKDNLTDSCDTLFTKWRQERGLKPVPHMRFDDYQRENQ